MEKQTTSHAYTHPENIGSSGLGRRAEGDGKKGTQWDTHLQ